MTPLLEADEMAMAFNTVAERLYWKATLGSLNRVPTVHFTSKSSMVKLTYYPANKRFAITFTKVSCAFGDFMASAYSSLAHVLLALKAAGYDLAAPLDNSDGVLRVEFDPVTKESYVQLAKLDDDWQEYAEPVFKGNEIIL